LVDFILKILFEQAICIPDVLDMKINCPAMAATTVILVYGQTYIVWMTLLELVNPYHP
jgi:hypothetical protein